MRAIRQFVKLLLEGSNPGEGLALCVISDHDQRSGVVYNPSQAMQKVKEVLKTSDNVSYDIESAVANAADGMVIVRKPEHACNDHGRSR